MRSILNYLHSNFTICSAVLIICVFTLFFQSPFPPYKNYTHDKKSILSDGFGYYSYLPAIFIYEDLSFSFFNDVYKKNYQADPPSWVKSFIVNTKTGIVNKYWIGVSFLLLPFFFIAHWLSLLLGYDADGYSVFYQYAVFFAGIFYLYLGCRFIYKFLVESQRISKLISSIAIFIVVFGTNLFYYSVYEPSMSHVYSFFSISGFIYYTTKYFKNFTLKYLMLMSAFFILLFLIRPINIISLSLVPFFSGDKQTFIKGILSIYRLKVKILLPLSLTLLLLIQVYTWRIQTGSWIVWSYPGERFYFLNPHFFDILFSYRKGFFVYMPACFIALTGLIVVFKRSFFQLFSLLFALLFITYILSSWYAWDYSACYGNRAFIDYYFVFALLIALSLNVFQNKIYFWSIFLIYTILTFFNHIQIYQYRHSIYHSIDMNKENYWKVFLKTEKGYENILYDWTDISDSHEIRKLKKNIFFSTFNNFENITSFWNNSNLEEKGFALSGRKVAVVSNNLLYGAGLSLSEKDIMIKQNIIIETDLFAYLYNDVSNAYIVHQIENNNKTIYWKSYKISTKNALIKKWKNILYLTKVPLLNKDDKLSVYLINAGNSSVYYDNMKVTLYSY